MVSLPQFRGVPKLDLVGVDWFAAPPEPGLFQSPNQVLVIKVVVNEEVHKNINYQALIFNGEIYLATGQEHCHHWSVRVGEFGQDLAKLSIEVGFS